MTVTRAAGVIGFAASICACFGDIGRADQTQSVDPVVVELFTSQGCSACPSADALIGELAGRPDIIALALHVDYWNYLGWRDVFGSPANTRRQKAYVAALGESTIYTPQMVIDGAVAVVGSRRDEVTDEIAVAAATPHRVAVSLVEDGEEIVATVSSRGEPAAGRVLYFIYEPPTSVSIGRGENAGRRYTYSNAVRTWMALGAFAGETRVWRTPKPQDARGVAVIVEDPSDHGVLGAAKIEFEPWSSQLSAAAPGAAAASQ